MYGDFKTHQIIRRNNGVISTIVGTSDHLNQVVMEIISFRQYDETIKYDGYNWCPSYFITKSIVRGFDLTNRKLG